MLMENINYLLLHGFVFICYPVSMSFLPAVVAAAIHFQYFTQQLNGIFLLHAVDEPVDPF